MPWGKAVRVAGAISVPDSASAQKHPVRAACYGGDDLFLPMEDLVTTLQADGRVPEPLFAYVQELKALGKQAFGERYGSAFLLLDTGTVRNRAGMAATTLEPRPFGADDETTAPTSFEVLPVRSRAGEDVVRVGRTDDCDVVIHDQSVSSLHAIFERSPTGALSLKDNGSKNGTFVDERFVGKGSEAHPLGSRHSLRFGSLSVVFLDLDGFVEMAKLFDSDVK